MPRTADSRELEREDSFSMEAFRNPKSKWYIKPVDPPFLGGYGETAAYGALGLGALLGWRKFAGKTNNAVVKAVSNQAPEATDAATDTAVKIFDPNKMSTRPPNLKNAPENAGSEMMTRMKNWQEAQNLKGTSEAQNLKGTSDDPLLFMNEQKLTNTPEVQIALGNKKKASSQAAQSQQSSTVQNPSNVKVDSTTPAPLSSLDELLLTREQNENISAQTPTEISNSDFLKPRTEPTPLSNTEVTRYKELITPMSLPELKALKKTADKFQRKIIEKRIKEIKNPTPQADTPATPPEPELKNAPEKTNDRLVDLNLIAQTNNAKLEDYRKRRSEAASKQVPRPPEKTNVPELKNAPEKTKDQQLYDSIIGRDKIGTNLLGTLLSWRQRPNANTANLDLITDPSITKQKSFWALLDNFLGKRPPAPAQVADVVKPATTAPYTRATLNLSKKAGTEAEQDAAFYELENRYFRPRPQIEGIKGEKPFPTGRPFSKQNIAEGLNSFVNYFRFADDLGVSRSNTPSLPVYNFPQSTQVASRRFTPRSIWNLFTRKQKTDILNTAEVPYPDVLKQIEDIAGRTSRQPPPNLSNSPTESVPGTPQLPPDVRRPRTLQEQKDSILSLPTNARARLAKLDTDQQTYKQMRQITNEKNARWSAAVSKLKAEIRSDSRLDKTSPDYNPETSPKLKEAYNQRLLRLEEGLTTRKLNAELERGDSFRRGGFKKTLRALGNSVLKLDKDMDLEGIGAETAALIQKTEKEWQRLDFAGRAKLMEKYNVLSAREAKKSFMEDTINMEGNRLKELSDLPDATELDKKAFTDYQLFNQAWREKYGYDTGPKTSQIFGDATTDNFNKVRTQAGPPEPPRITEAPEPAIDYNAAPGTIGYESVSTKAALDTLRRRLNLAQDATPLDILDYAGSSSEPKNHTLEKYIRDSMIKFDEQLTDVDLPQPKQKLLLNHYASKFNVNLTKIQKALKNQPLNAERKSFPDAVIEAITEAATKQGREDEIGPLTMWGALNRDQQIELWHKLNSADAGKGSSAVKLQRVTPGSETLIGRAEFPVLNETSASAKEMRLKQSPTPTLTTAEGDTINRQKQHIRLGNVWIKTVTDKNNNITTDAVSKIMNALKNAKIFDEGKLVKIFDKGKLDMVEQQLLKAKKPEELNDILSSLVGKTGGKEFDKAGYRVISPKTAVGREFFTKQMFAAAPFAATPLLPSNSSRDKESRPNAPRLTFAP